MKRCFVILAMVLSVIGYSGTAFAQYDALPHAYIKMDGGFFSKPKVVIDGKELGQWEMDGLINAVAKNPVSQDYIKKYRADQYWSLGTLSVGAAAALTYLAASSGTDNSHFKSGTYWGLFLAGAIPSIIFAHYATANLLKAINIYNGIDEKRASNWHFSIGPIADGATGGLSWSF